MENNSNKKSLKEYLDKLKEILINLKSKLAPKLLEIDSKFATFMPNQKLRKIVYIATGSLFSFMFLIILLGILLMPLRSGNTTSQSLFRKPNIIQESPKPQIELNENQKQLNGFKKEIDNLSFPDNRINIPVIERELSIDQSR